MKYLTLIRHAIAQQPQTFQLDSERCLSKAGKSQLEVTAKQLKERGCLPDFLLCSPAKRAVQTAKILCQALKIMPNRIQQDIRLYGDNLAVFLDLIQSLTTPQRLFLVGHNPKLSELAHCLCPATEAIMLATAGVISLSLPIKHWQDLMSTPGQLLFSMNTVPFS